MRKTPRYIAEESSAPPPALPRRGRHRGDGRAPLGLGRAIARAALSNPAAPRRLGGRPPRPAPLDRRRARRQPRGRRAGVDRAYASAVIVSPARDGGRAMPDGFFRGMD